MFKVMSTKNIANMLIIILTVIILTVSGVILTKAIKNKLNCQNEQQPKIINAESI